MPTEFTVLVGCCAVDSVPEISANAGCIHTGDALTDPVPVWDKYCFVDVKLPASLAAAGVAFS